MRTVIEKYQRLAQIQSQYAEKIEALAEKQLAIQKKLLIEFKLNEGYEYHNNTFFDFLKVGENGEVELWERGRCGDGDSWSTSITIHDLILKNDLEGYEKLLRGQYKTKAEAALVAKEKEKQTKRQTLQKELARINAEMGKLGGAS